MLQDILSIGDKIDVQQLDHMGRPIKDAATSVSQIIDFKDSDSINIAMPMVGSRTIPMKLDAQYNLCFYTVKGLYQCNCIVTGRFREEHMVAATVKITSALEKYQRRQYYRIECIIDIEYRVITKEEMVLEALLLANDFSSPQIKQECQNKLLEYDKGYQSGIIVDISGGGIRFTSECSHSKGDKIILKLEISSSKRNKKYSLRANVVSSNKIHNKINTYEHRVEFTDIDKKEREEIIKFIFEQERQKRQLRRKTELPFL